MIDAGKTPVVLHADQEHSGLRFVIFISLFLGFFIGFRLIAWLIENFGPAGLLDYTTFLACAGAIPFAMLVIWGLEKILKRYWHSGLSFVLDDTGLTVRDKRNKSQATFSGEQTLTLRWSANMSVLKWYFKLSGYPRGGRERRTPAKWFCLAAELYEDESRLNVYTFMPPDKAARLIEDAKAGFQRINQAELYERSIRSRVGPPSRPTIPNELLHSKEGRYWLAERRRWQYGIELSAEDFTTLLEYAGDAIAASPPLTTETNNINSI